MVSTQAGAKLLLFNDPHNPTGHRFSEAERDAIARLCAKHDVVIVTDEIYEHMCFRGGPYATLAAIIYFAFSLADLYGVALAALGMLSTLATGLTIDGYGPVTDNAGGIAEICVQIKSSTRLQCERIRMF